VLTVIGQPVAPLFPDLASPAPRAKFRFIDLFAGIGGIRTGLERAGGECVYTVEFDRFAMQTYSANFGRFGADGRRRAEPPRDIYDVRVEDLQAYEVLAAGFPCQPFSLAGVSKKLSLGRAHGFQDKKSGNLFFEIARLIDETRTPPPVLFLENVKHLLRHDQGKTFRVIRDTLEDRGYNLSVDVVDAQSWVPQHRERTFIIGLHRDVYGEQCFIFPDRPVGTGPTLGDILEPSADPKYTLSQHLWDYLQAYAQKHRAAGNGFGFGLVDETSVTRTLSARYHKDGSEILIRQPGTRPRRLTPRECARLMGYSDSFVVPVSDTQAYRQFGNSVVVPVIEWLGRALAEQAFPEVRSRRRRRIAAAG
jgi:DNA (cytosine-5)-methyltransferase 1